MKYISIIILALQQIGCSSSSYDPLNKLVGNWTSNCHERTDPSGTVLSFTIRTLIITQDTFDMTNSDHTDINCRIPEGASYTIPYTYALGERVITTDGAMAQRITLQSEFNLLLQPVKTTTNSIFRVTGVDLNFGDYIDGATPTINYAITYTRQ